MLKEETQTRVACVELRVMGVLEFYASLSLIFVSTLKNSIQNLTNV